MEKRFLNVCIAILLLIFLSCQKKSAPPLFEKLPPQQTGVTFENALVEEALMNSINYLYFYDGGGVAVGDINNDGLTDLFLTANQQFNRLYLNQGNFQFTDITEAAGVGGGTAGWATGATMADVNGDGFLDIYVCYSNYLDRQGANQLFINNGDMTFTERAAEFGLAHTGLSRQAAFFDYDGDGDLDMYLLNHSVHAKNTYGERPVKQAINDAEAGDQFFRNDNGHFRNVTAESGIYQNILGYGLGIAVSDINWDGYPDIYISNDFHEDDYLYYNNGDGTFREAMRQSMQHISSASMGNDIADFNNDGLPDVVVLDMLPEKEEIRKSSINADPYDVNEVKLNFGYHHQYRRNTLQLNRGPALNPDGTAAQPAVHLFSEIGQFAGIHATDWSWAALFADLDNDGWKDLFISNGIYRRPNDFDYLHYLNLRRGVMESGGRPGDLTPDPLDKEKLDDWIAHMPSVPEPNYAFHNRGDLTFANRAAEWGLGDPGFSSGAAYADFDNDGDLDLVVNNINAPAGIYRNRLRDRPADASPPAYLTVMLKGKRPNTFGIGAKVRLHAAGMVQHQELMPVRGFQSAVEPRLHFGLANAAQADSLEVIWPTGEYQVLRGVAANQQLTVRQSDATERYAYPPPHVAKRWLREVTGAVALDYRHQENTFIEFNREPFIPHFISTEGPAMAVGDVNGDGLDDLFLGGAKFQPGGIFLQNRRGGFDALPDTVWAADSRNEDVDAAFFDADGDGRLDLYVVSGGNEFFGEAEPLRDRLYLNRAEGHFRKADPAAAGLDFYANGACVAPADFDGDGDVDLFVGSRSVPREYGAIPESFLLINDGAGHFSNQTTGRAPALANVGMVTAAVWADVNRDDRPDLVVAGEWMPVTVFINQNGKLANATETWGLQNTTGWWNCLTAGDVNGDGWVDLIAGNLGLNSFLKAAPESPIRLYLNDFSGQGRRQQILTFIRNGKEYPFASVDQLLTHIPPLRSKFTSYADFGSQTLREMFPPEQLESAELRTVTEFASMLLLNRGKTGEPGFHLRKLPAEAQFSPVYSILLEDINADGHADLLLGGNLYGVPPDRGRYDASYGTLMFGNGAGEFSPVSLPESGFVLTGEVREIQTLQNAAGQTWILAARSNDRVAVFQKMLRATASGPTKAPLHPPGIAAD